MVRNLELPSNIFIVYKAVLYLPDTIHPNHSQVDSPRGINTVNVAVEGGRLRSDQAGRVMLGQHSVTFAFSVTQRHNQRTNLIWI